MKTVIFIYSCKPKDIFQKYFKSKYIIALCYKNTLHISTAKSKFIIRTENIKLNSSLH